MCTVTYLPVSKKEFIITSNRDEDIARPTLPVAEYTINNKTLYFPKDQRANGTWIAHQKGGYTLCLLNGANQPHIRKEQYKKSRGLVVLDFYDYNDPEKFATSYDFEGIEPFTLVMASADEQTLLYELKWDEKKAELIKHDASLPHIWSSVTLYTPEMIHAREKWFHVWLEKNTAYTIDAVLFFHHFAGDGTNENNLVMNRGARRTVSITCVSKNENFTEIVYEDLVKEKKYEKKV